MLCEINLFDSLLLHLLNQGVWGNLGNLLSTVPGSTYLLSKGLNLIIPICGGANLGLCSSGLSMKPIGRTYRKSPTSGKKLGDFLDIQGSGDVGRRF